MRRPGALRPLLVILTYPKIHLLPRYSLNFSTLFEALAAFRLIDFRVGIILLKIKRINREILASKTLDGR